MPNRRTFLIGGLGATVLGAGTYAWLRQRGYAVDPGLDSGASEPRPRSAALPHAPFDPRAKAVLAALVDTLLPGDGARGVPSATEAGVLDYVVAAAALPGLGAVRTDLLKLTRHLDLAAKGVPDPNAPTSVPGFAELDPEGRHARVAALQTDEGAGRFSPALALEVALRFSLEGYLGHPHHGGNKDAASWDALTIPMPRARVAHHGHGGPETGEP